MDIAKLQRQLTPAEDKALTDFQRDLHKQFETGGTVTHLGARFEVLPGVFPPRPDSLGIIQNMITYPGDRVLDVCCGSGVIGIMAAKQRASCVLGLDLNPQAVACSIKNAANHRLSCYEARISDMFLNLRRDEQFDVVTFNPPYRDMPTSRMVERTTWDPNLIAHEKFFLGIGYHVRPKGRIYFAQANYGELDRIQLILNHTGWNAELLAERPLDVIPGLKFLTFEITRP